MTDKKQTYKGFYKILFTIAVPIILQNLMQTFVNMLDTVMVGQLGATEIAAVGLGNQIFFMLNMVLFGICSGGSIFIAQYWGSRNIAGIRKSLGIMLCGAVTTSLVFFAGGVFVPDVLISLYTNDIEVIQIAADYLRIVVFSYPMMAVSFALQMSFRSTEHVKLPMVSTIISFGLNGLFNWLLIFGIGPVPAFGVIGAALATLISRLVELFITVLWSYSSKYESCGTMKEYLSFDKKFIARFIKISIPVIISESCWGLGITVQNSIYAHTGTDAFAAFSITNTISQLTWVFFIGMGNASSIIMGKKIGAGDIEGTKAYAFRYSWFLPLLGLAGSCLLFPLSCLLPLLFNVDRSIIAIAKSMLYILMVTYPFRAFNMLLIVGILRCGGDTIYSSIIDNGWMWLVALPLGAVAAFVWNLPPFAIMLCLEIEQLLKTLSGIPRVVSGKWLHNVTL